MYLPDTVGGIHVIFQFRTAGKWGELSGEQAQMEERWEGKRREVKGK